MKLGNNIKNNFIVKGHTIKQYKMDPIKEEFADEIFLALKDFHRLTPIQQDMVRRSLSKIGLGIGNKKIKFAQKISEKAFELYKNYHGSGFYNEHMVPKSMYILDPLIDIAKKRDVTPKEVEDLVDKYWFIAFITEEEENRLLPTRTKMPSGWNGQDVFARYCNTGIKLLDFDDNLRGQLGVSSVQEVANEIQKSITKGCMI